MISCQNFRATLEPGTRDAKVLEHLRRCDACLDYAIQVDPDNFFRLLGGDELVPPGGVDAFVGDVMTQVRSRQTETAAQPHHTFTNMRRLAVAATIAAAVTTGLVVSNRQPAERPVATIAQHAALSTQRSLVTKPVVETYDSKNATIVEVPKDGKDDVQVVMIFDESLPADL